MESINFKFVKEYDEEFYNQIVEAETKAKINVEDAGVALRKSLERLCNIKISECGLNANEIKEKLGKHYQYDLQLTDKIEFLKISKINQLPKQFIQTEDKIYFTNKSIKPRKIHKIDFIRKFCNLCAHEENEKNQLVINYDNLLLCFKYYHDLLKIYISNKPIFDNFKEDSMPIGKYYLNHIMPISNEEKKITGCESEYMMKCISSKNINLENWAIVRVYRKEKLDKNFISRPNDTFLNTQRRLGNAPTGINPIEVISHLDNDKSPFYIIAYQFDVEPYKLEDVLEKLNINERYNICYQIAECFESLHNSKRPIYHRMLTRNAIYLCDYSDQDAGWMAAVTKFHFSKIDTNNINTVFNNAVNAFDFIELIDKKYLRKPLEETDSNTNWAKWDIYSMGILFREILVGSIEKDIIDDDRLKTTGVSNELIQFLNSMIGLELRQPDITSVVKKLYQYK